MANSDSQLFLFCAQSMSFWCRCIFLTENRLFNGVNVLARSFSAAAAVVLTRCRTRSVSQSSAAVGPLLNASIVCPEINSIFSTVTLIVSQNFYHYFVLSLILNFQVVKKKSYIIIVVSWLIEYCHTGNFGFPVLIKKIFESRKLLGEF